MATQFHCCALCNRKYKTLAKYEKHVDEVHPDAVLKRNNAVLTLDEKLHLIDCFERYTALLTTGSDADFARATEGLNFEGAGRLEQMIGHHVVFRKRVIESGLLRKATSDSKQVLVLLDEFQRFLNLGKPGRGGNFCPSLTIDLIWHSIMTMDPGRYRVLSMRFLGEVLPHCLEANEGHETERFANFERLFNRHFGWPCLIVDALVIGNDVNAFEGARKILMDEQENTRLRYEAMEDERRAREAQNVQLFVSRYSRPSWDDGKC